MTNRLLTAWMKPRATMMYVLLLRQTDCVNCFGSTGHGSTLRPLHASVRLHPSCNPGTTALTLLVSSRQTRLTSAASDVGRHIPDEVHLDSGQ